MSDLYVVMSVTLITWVGLFLYLLRVDIKVKEAQKREEI
jgi:CcmD family protein